MCVGCACRCFFSVVLCLIFVFVVFFFFFAVIFYRAAADFDPASLSSRLKVEVSGSLLTVKIDSKNTGTWTDCAQVR